MTSSSIINGILLGLSVYIAAVVLCAGIVGLTFVAVKVRSAVTKYRASPL